MGGPTVESVTNGAEFAAWKDVALLLLGSAADHAVHCAESEVEPFRQRVRESMDGLQTADSPTQVLVNAGGVAQAITHYAQQTQSEVDALLTDVRDATRMFLSHLEKFHADAESQPAMVALRASMEEALREGKLGLAREAAAASLAELATLAVEKRTQALELTSKLQDRITVLEKSMPKGFSSSTGAPSASVDSSTGLPKRSEAEAALNQALETASESGPQLYAAVFYLHRMALTNARFGEAIGNQVLLFCSQHIAAVTRANDSLFRWSGPAFVAILERQESEMAVSGEVQRLISTPFSRFFETSARSVYLPVKVTAEVIPLFDSNFAEVTDRLERFILTTSGQAGAA